MAVSFNQIVTPQTPKMGLAQFSTADSTGTYKTVYTGGPNGSKIIASWAQNSDAAAHTVTLQIQRSTLNNGGVTTSIPLSAGFANAVPPVNLMAAGVWPGLPLDSDQNPFIFLQSTADILVATFSTAMAAGTVVDVAAVGADF